MVETWVLLIWAISAQGTWKWFDLTYSTYEECEGVRTVAGQRVRDAGEGGRGVVIRECRRAAPHELR